MKAILIDVSRREVREVEVRNFDHAVSLVECEIVEAIQVGGMDVLYVDEEGCFIEESERKYFCYAGYPTPLIGNGLVIGYKRSGENCSVHRTLAEIRAAVSFSSPKANVFDKWLDTFIAEKDLDLEYEFQVEGQSGTNFIPLEIIVQLIKGTNPKEQKSIKDMIVRIDFANGNVMSYFEHLAKGVAK